MIRFLLLVAVMAHGCSSCRAAPRTEPPPEPDDPTDVQLVQPSPDLPHVDQASLGLSSPDPGQEAFSTTRILKVRAFLVVGEAEQAAQALEKILEASPTNLEARLVKAEMLAREGDIASALSIARTLLEVCYPEYADRILESKALSSLHRTSPQDWSAFLLYRDAVRGAWAEAMSHPGVFLLVAPPFPAGSTVEPDEERLSRGWVVFLDATTGRFLPLTPRASIAGFLIDRADRRLVTLSWASYDREEKDAEGETVRPALLGGVRVSTTDLATFESTPDVPLGDGVVEARLQVRSGHVLAALRSIDRESGEPAESTLEIDLASDKAAPAAAAGPGPMDLVVSYGEIVPPSSPPGEGTAMDALPEGWRCLAAGKGFRVCAVPSSKKSVLSDIVLANTNMGSSKTTLASGLGILQMDVL